MATCKVEVRDELIKEGHDAKRVDELRILVDKYVSEQTARIKGFSLLSPSEKQAQIDGIKRAGKLNIINKVTEHRVQLRREAAFGIQKMAELLEHEGGFMALTDKGFPVDLHTRTHGLVEGLKATGPKSVKKAIDDELRFNLAKMDQSTPRVTDGINSIVYDKDLRGKAPVVDREARSIRLGDVTWESITDSAAELFVPATADTTFDAQVTKALGAVLRFQGGTLPEGPVLTRALEIAYRLSDGEQKQIQPRIADRLEALRAALVPSNRAYRQSGHVSVSTQAVAMRQEYQGRFINSLSRTELKSMRAKDSPLQHDIARELFELRRGNGEGAGISKNARALEIAKDVDNLFKELKDRANAAGADIKHYDGYIARTTHNTTAMLSRGSEAWKGDMMHWLNLERTFPGMDTAQRMIALTEMFKEISYGETATPAWVGSPSMAKALSEHRELHFKDAESWLKYNKHYGQGDLLKTFATSIDSLAKSISVIEALGPRPLDTLSKMRSSIEAQAGNDTEKLQLISKRFKWIDNYAAALTGTYPDSPANGTFLKWGRTVKNMITMAKLGGVTISALGDVPTMARTIHYAGGSYIGGYFQAAGNIFSMLKPIDRMKVGRSIGIGFESTLSHISDRFATGDQATGLMSKAVNTFFKWNLLGSWTDAHKAGVAAILMNDFADGTKLPFEKLNKRMQRTLLSDYGIQSADWEKIRKSEVHVSKGKSYLIPEDVKKVDLELGRRYQLVISDLVESAVLTPGTRESALLKFGYSPSSNMGLALSLLTQFRSYSLSTVTKLMTRDLNPKLIKSGELTSGEFAFNIAHTALMTTLFGYGAMTLKDLAKGKKPRDIFENPGKTIAAAFAQAGGAGIFGDFLYGAMSRHDQSLIATLAGPTGGLIEDLYKPIASALSGNAKDIPAEILNLLKNNAPFVNLFYTRAALDYLLLYGLQEFFSPGYLRRMEKSAKKNQGSEFIAPPSRNARRW